MKALVCNHHAEGVEACCSAWLANTKTSLHYHLHLFSGSSWSLDEGEAPGSSCWGYLPSVKAAWETRECSLHLQTVEEHRCYWTDLLLAIWSCTSTEEWKMLFIQQSLTISRIQSDRHCTHPSSAPLLAGDSAFDFNLSRRSANQH